jgi:hypothetical protein
MRHLVTFLLFFFTIVCFYRIALKHFKTWKLPFLGSVMFMLTPRLFAHGFYNPKDIPALFFFTLCALTMVRMLETKSTARIVMHALTTGLLISVRIFGLLMPVLTLLFLWMGPRKRQSDAVTHSLMYAVGVALFLFLCWPYLWTHPLGLFTSFFSSTTRMGGGFYFGHNFSAAGVPWHYLPVWMAITIPVMYSLLFVIGLGMLLLRCIRRPNCLLKDQQVMGMALLWFLLPVSALLTGRIGIFDEWRHLLFLYPAFLLIALEGFRLLCAALKKWHWIICGLLGLQMLMTGIWMIRNHPFEYAYFSIPTRFIEGKFDLDYWGLSYRAGLEWIVKNDQRPVINVSTAASVGIAAGDTLPLNDWDRLRFVTPDKADYILDNFRGSEYKDPFPPEREVHAIIVDGLKILAIESLRAK